MDPKADDWLDVLYNACCVGHGCGVRIVEESVAAAPEPTPERPENRV